MTESRILGGLYGAALWCCARHGDYRGAVLEAVNLETMRTRPALHGAIGIGPVMSAGPVG